MRTDPLENEIKRSIIDYLTISGVMVWRQNTAAFAIPATETTKRRFLKFGVPGMSDIIGILPPEGRLLAIEVKGPGKKPTMSQDAFLEQVRQLGGVAFWADSLDDVMRWHRSLERRAG